jgi:hypothetical protein
MAAVAIWIFCKPDPPVWRLRTTFHIGSSINRFLLVDGQKDPQGAIERYSTVVGLISTPAFRQSIAEGAKFSADSAARSKQSVFETLHANAVNDYDIEIEFIAASSQDSLAAYRVIADQIEQRHSRMMEQDTKVLQSAIDDYRDRSTQLRTWEDARLHLSQQMPADSEVLKTDLTETWNQTREKLRRLETIKAMVAPTRFPPESEVYVTGPLTGVSVRMSALAGLCVVIFAVAGSIGLEHFIMRRRNRIPRV